MRSVKNTDGGLGAETVDGDHGRVVRADVRDRDDVALLDLRHRMVLGEQVVALVDVTGHGDASRLARRRRHDTGSGGTGILIDEVLVHHVPAGVQSDEGRAVTILDAHDLGEMNRALLREELPGLGAHDDVERPQVLREDARPRIEVEWIVPSAGTARRDHLPC